MAAPIRIDVEKGSPTSKKRSAHDKTSENVPRKKSKINRFDHIEFKSYLKDPQSANSGKGPKV